MRLLNLQLENWACHPNLEIDFSRGLQIEGRNGTGKSSILEAIRFCFAEKALGYKIKIKNGAREARVRLAFQKDNGSYLIEKTLHLEKPSAAQMLCNSNVIADNPSSVHERLNDILSEDVLERLLYVPQGGLTGIIDGLKQKGGKQELDALFGLDRLEQVWQGAGERIKENKTKLSLINEQIAKYPDNAEEEYGIEIESLGNRIGELSENSKSLGEKTGELSKKIESLEREIERQKKTKREVESAREEVNKLNVKKAKTEEEMSGLNRDLSEIEQKKTDLKVYADRIEKLRKFVPVRELLQKLTSVQERLGALDIEGDKKTLDELQEFLVDKDKLDKELKANEVMVKDLGNMVATTSRDLELASGYLKELTELKGKAKCPKCGQRLTEVHLIEERQKTELGVKKLDSRLANMRVKLKGIEEIANRLRNQLSDMQEKEAQEKQLRKSLAERIKEREKLEKESAELVEKLKQNDYRNEPMNEVETHIENLNSARGMADVLGKDIRHEKELLGRGEELTRGLEGIKNRIEEMMSKISGLQYSEVEFEKIVSEKDSVVEERHKVSAEMKQLEFRIKENEGKVNELGGKRGDYLKIKEDKKHVERRINLLTRARDVFHTDKGLPKFLRDRYIHHLSDLLTHYFKRLNQNPIYKEIFFDKDYNIQLKTTTGLLSLEQLSGGEKVQLAVSLRIALIEMLSPIRLLILDEPFGSLDADHRELLGEALNKMGQSWQLILVTHIHVDSLQLETFELGGY